MKTVITEHHWAPHAKLQMFLRQKRAQCIPEGIASEALFLLCWLFSQCRSLSWLLLLAQVSGSLCVEAFSDEDILLGTGPLVLDLS